MRIRLAIPDKHVDEDLINAALEASTRAAERQVQAGDVPTAEEAIARGVKWRPENFGDGEHFDLPSVVIGRGWGDCDDLASWQAGSMRATGEDPGAIARVVPSGPKRWHAVVETSSGDILDPSRWAGMGSKRGLRGAVHGRMCAPGVCGFAVVPHGKLYAARADLPWGDDHLSGMALARTREDALVGAVRGCVLAGEGIVGDDVIGHASELCGSFVGDAEEIGSFLDSITSAIPGVANLAVPGAGSVLSALGMGGGGAPAPGAAAPAPGPAMAGPGAMQSIPLPGGGHVAYSPDHRNGPVIVRF